MEKQFDTEVIDTNINDIITEKKNEAQQRIKELAKHQLEISKPNPRQYKDL